MQQSESQIYYMNLDIAYKKNKSTINKESWAVSRWCSPEDIMKNCKRTMNRLAEECYGKTFKGDKRIIIRGVRDVKWIGHTNIKRK